MALPPGNNQSFGSPVNRIKITGYWASRSQTRNTKLPFIERLKEWWRHFAFQAIMFQLDVIFWKSRFLQWFSTLRARFHLGGTGKGKRGFEDELEESMRGFAKDNLGIEMSADVFAG